MSSSLRTSPQGGILLFLPCFTVLTKRSWSSGNRRRSGVIVPELTMLGPWQCEHRSAKIALPRSILAGFACSPAAWSALTGSDSAFCCAVAARANANAIDRIARAANAAAPPKRPSITRDLPCLTGLLRLDREHPQRSAGRHVGQPLVAGEQRVDAAIAGVDGNVLHAILLPGHRLTLDARAGLELPQLLAGVGVEGFELAGQLAGEDDATGGRQHAREARNVARHFPFGLAGHGIDRLERAARPGAPIPEISQVHAEIPFAGLVGGRLGLVVAAEGQGVGIGQPEIGRASCRERV